MESSEKLSPAAVKTDPDRPGIPDPRIEGMFAVNPPLSRSIEIPPMIAVTVPVVENERAAVSISI